MKRILSIAIALGVAGFLLADDVSAHGGSFRGPSGGVPPGLREPSDPEPPPPPPSDPGTPGGPTTPGEPPPQGPTTPPDQGHDTPDSSPAPTPIAPQGADRKKATTKSLTFESWRFWWGYNNDDILNLKSHIYSSRTSSSSPLFFASREDEENRRNAQRPTEAAILRTIIPALERCLDRPDDHEDIHGGAMVAIGKIGSAKHISLLRDALVNEHKSSKGRKIEFGYQATESAVLALGLLPNLDDTAKDTIRQICLETIQRTGKDAARTRERTWAAVAMGLQRDEKAVEPMIKLLEVKYPDSNVPAGLIVGLGLTQSPAAIPALTEILEQGKFNGQEFDDRTQAFAAYALGKLGEPGTKEAGPLVTIMKVLKSRRFGRIVKRSAAIAAGMLGAKGDEDMKKEAVATLEKFIRKSGGDPSGENFAIIALSQIGTPDALNGLIKIADSGKYGQRPFAGLGLATHVFYNDRDSAAKKAEPMDRQLRAKIVDNLRTLSDKYKDSDTKAAFMLARGLVQDKTAIEELTEIAAKKSGDPVLRGFCCVALGLIGDASDEVKRAMKFALGERKSVDLRRDAATGLALLRDAEVVKILLDELKKAKSFAVQGQLITAIGTIGDHTAIEDLVEILDNKSQPAQTRAMAAVGLGMIGDLREIPALSRVSKDYNYRASVKDLDELLFIL